MRNEAQGGEPVNTRTHIWYLADLRLESPTLISSGKPTSPCGIQGSRGLVVKPNRLKNLFSKPQLKIPVGEQKQISWKGTYIDFEMATQIWQMESIWKGGDWFSCKRAVQGGPV